MSPKKTILKTGTWNRENQIAEIDPSNASWIKRRDEEYACGEVIGVKIAHTSWILDPGSFFKTTFGVCLSDLKKKKR